VTPRDKLRRAVFENLNLKLLSFGGAILLYSLVHSGQHARRSVVVDLEANLPSESANRVLMGSIPHSVRVTIRGASQAVDNLRASDVILQLDLSTGRESHVTFDSKMLHGPNGITFDVEQFEPSSIDLQWEDRVTRDLPVQVSVVGTPAIGFVVKGVPQADPLRVKVRGPTSEVASLQHVRVDGFDVGGLSEGNYPRQLSTERLPGHLTVEPKNVVVTAEIARELAERPFAKLPVAVVGMPRAKTLPSEVDVRLVCPPDMLRGLRPEQIVPRVELQTKEPSGSEARSVIVLVDKCEAHVTPASVVVKW
jgi:hypothetical protein